jgi:nucleoside-specific outer membrane channel protein Tsx
MTNIKNQVFNRSQLWAGKGGRDYIKVGTEIFSINGLYCDKDGNQDRWGAYVTIMDIRWVVVGISSHDGALCYEGDGNDIQALDHWGYQWATKDQFPVGDYKRVPWGEHRRTIIAPQEVE